ncbi:hypothetical protein C7271_12115 [filamentous cyanobacterium CCP5]|nr:hypothetical protein C7271_12115 [filamentous cyanobacterium CCP5]
MSYLHAARQAETGIKNSTLILITFATVFFPRLLSFFGAPSAINFAHFAVVLGFAGYVVAKAKPTPKQRQAAGQLAFAIGALLVCEFASALLNQAGLINVCISFMLLAEPFIFLLALTLVPLTAKSLEKVNKWVLIFATSNLGLALAQAVLLPIGLYPRPGGGTIEDNITGVFGGGGGSAGNYVSCTISFYIGLLLLQRFKGVPIWIRGAFLFASVAQIQISDSKQVFLALVGGWALLALTKVKNPRKLIIYSVLAISFLMFAYWAILNLDYGFLSAYRNWLTRDGLFGLEGKATLAKTAAFRTVPTYYSSILNWFFGLGPGHTVSRLGGWILRDYSSLLAPLGSTVSEVSQAVPRSVEDGWLLQESTVYSPSFTWAGIWGDLGFVGLGSYLFICLVVWKQFCVDDFCRFLLLSTAAFGLIITQMEEPGHVLTVAILIGLKWHERRLRNDEISRSYMLGKVTCNL